MPPLTGSVVPTLTVRDLEKSTAWYRQVFGMEVRYRYQDQAACLVAQQSGLELCLVTHEANEGDEFSEFRTGLDHLEFLVAERSDLDTWATHLDALRIQHSGVKQPEYTENAMLSFRDPDNIQLELFWRAPGPFLN